MNESVPTYTPPESSWLNSPERANVREAAEAALAAINDRPKLTAPDRLAALSWALGGEIAIQGDVPTARQGAYDIAAAWMARVCNEYAREMDAAAEAGRQ